MLDIFLEKKKISKCSKTAFLITEQYIFFSIKWETIKKAFYCSFFKWHQKLKKKRSHLGMFNGFLKVGLIIMQNLISKNHFGKDVCISNIFESYRKRLIKSIFGKFIIRLHKCFNIIMGCKWSINLTELLTFVFFFYFYNRM